VQRTTAQSKTGIFRDHGVAEAPPGFQAGWSDCMYFSLFLSVSDFIPDYMSEGDRCLFVALGRLKTQTARHL
jgi:hypothetical protein